MSRIGNKASNPPPPTPEPQSPAMPVPMTNPGWRKARPYAGLSALAFLGMLLLLVRFSPALERLFALGLLRSAYFVVLVLLGLCAVAFLFGAMPSSARYRGGQAGGRLELGGAVVGLCLVLWFGSSYAPTESLAFDLTVFVQGEGGASDLVLRQAGRVWLQVGADRKREAIDDKGQATFRDLSARFRRREALVWVEADRFETVAPASPQRLTGESLTLVVRRKPVVLLGRLQDEKGQPVAGGLIRIGAANARSDGGGQFRLDLPGEAAANDVELEASASGFLPYRRSFPVGSRPAIVVLRKEP